jgi:hypothetical protein
MDGTSEEDRRILQEMCGRFGTPAFVRRAKLVETSWTELMTVCENNRNDQLAFVGLRLAQLLALAGGWDMIRANLDNTAQMDQLARLHAQLEPRLQMPLEPTFSGRILRSAAAELVEAIERFNARWKGWLARLDLSRVNKLRDEYNRYYVFEKECSVGNVKVARLGFRNLAPVSLQEIEQRFPTLDVPTFGVFAAA